MFRCFKYSLPPNPPPKYSRTQGLKRQLKALKAAYDNASAAVWEEQSAMTANSSKKRNSSSSAWSATAGGGEGGEGADIREEDRLFAAAAAVAAAATNSNNNNNNGHNQREVGSGGVGRSSGTKESNHEGSPSRVGSVRFLLSRKLTNHALSEIDPMIERLEDNFSLTLDNEVICAGKESVLHLALRSSGGFISLSILNLNVTSYLYVRPHHVCR